MLGLVSKVSPLPPPLKTLRLKDVLQQHRKYRGWRQCIKFLAFVFISLLIPLISLDSEEVFSRNVVNRFLSGYDDIEGNDNSFLIWNPTINNITYQTFDEFIVNDSVTFPFDMYRKCNDKRNTILCIPENKNIYLLKTNAYAHGCWDYPTTNDNDLEIYDDFNALYDTLNKLIENNNYLETFYDDDDSKQNDINQLNELSSILEHSNEFKYTFGNDWFYNITIYKCDKCE